MSSCQVEYPREVPIECIRELIGLLRGGDVWGRRSAFAKHLWTVQGYVQRLWLGEPISVMGEAEVLSDDEACAALEGWLEQARESSVADPGMNLPSRVLLRWLVTKLLELLTTSEG